MRLSEVDAHRGTGEGRQNKDWVEQRKDAKDKAKK